MLFLWLGGVHLAGIQKSSWLESRKAALPKYFLPFSMTEVQLQFVCAPPPLEGPQEKPHANLIHLIIPKWFSAGYI